MSFVVTLFRRSKKGSEKRKGSRKYQYPKCLNECNYYFLILRTSHWAFSNSLILGIEICLMLHKLLSAAEGQGPRNYSSCCCSCCGIFSFKTHTNSLSFSLHFYYFFNIFIFSFFLLLSMTISIIILLYMSTYLGLPT